MNEQIKQLALRIGKVLATHRDMIEHLYNTVYKYRGSVATYDALPNNATVGDVYSVDSGGEDGTNYVWTGSKWDALAGFNVIGGDVNEFLNYYNNASNG